MNDPILDALNRKIGNVRTGPMAPPEMHGITSRAESGGRDYTASGQVVTSPAGARGNMQVMDGTNVEPGFGVVPAHDGSLAERSRVGHDYLDAMTQRYGGDPAKAWAAYNAGPGRVDDAVARGGANWLNLMPPETRSYVQSNVAALGGDPQLVNTADPNDPVLSALNRAIDGGNGSVPARDPQEVGNPNSAAGGSGAAVGTAQGPVGRPDMENSAGPSGPEGTGGLHYTGPNVRGLRTLAEGVNDLYAGVGEGLDNVQNWIIGHGTRATDAIGLTNGLHDRFENVSRALEPNRDANYVNPNGWARSIGRFTGEAIPTAPVSEIRLLNVAPEAGAVARALGKYGNFAIQGGAGGAIASGGDDIMRHAAAGAALAPVVGATAEHIIAPVASRVWNAARDATGAVGANLGQAGDLLDKVGDSKVARMLRDYRAAPVEPQAGDPLPDVPGMGKWANGALKSAQDMADETQGLTGEVTDTTPNPKVAPHPVSDPIPRPDGGVTVKMSDGTTSYFAPGVDPATGLSKGWYRDADGQLRGPNGETGLDGVAVDDSPATNTEVPAAPPATSRGAAGARRGIESVPVLPKQVSAEVGNLKSQGVPDDQALNEAAVRYVGGQPTLGSSTRDFETMQTEQELAKEAGTPEGRALRTRQASNNAALHDAAQGTVTDYGGVPAKGEATEAAAKSLADASDAERARVSGLYDQARDQDGGKRVSIDALRELMDRPGFRAPTTMEGKQLVLGLRSQIDDMASRNNGRFTPDEIEQLWQEANRAYSPMGGGANAMVGDVKTALSESLDQFADAGPAYKAARDAHRQWAERYADPDGVAKLIERDAKGNFTNGDNWRRVENGLVCTTSDKGFIQVARQLQKNGDTASINKLKADIVQRAYEAATKGNADHLGNPVFVAKRWEESLNAIGVPKLQAIFSSEELGHLSIIGHAARALNEAVPGSVNTSGSAAALVNAARRVKDGAPINPAVRNVARALRGAGHVGATLMAPGKGNIMVEGVGSVANKIAQGQAKHAAGKALAEALVKTMDPAKARALESEELRRVAQQQEMARALSRQVGTASAAATSDARK